MKPTKEEIKTAFEWADTKQKDIITNLFGEPIWQELYRGYAVPFPTPSDKHERSTNAFFVLSKLADIKNGDWQADWTDESQDKWFPWFDARNSKFVFGSSGRGSWGCDFSARMCFKSEEVSNKFAQENTDLYKEWML